jgi:hypothetical protein
MQTIFEMGKIVSQAILLLNSVQLKAKPAYLIHINSQYYITYSRLKQVLEMTASPITYA